jgi:hypothetical protein
MLAALLALAAGATPQREPLDAELLRRIGSTAQGVHPELDLAAMRAVSQWRYTPTLLEGDPVPVYMTVTINFRLR